MDQKGYHFSCKIVLCDVLKGFIRGIQASVAGHYNARKDVGVEKRKESPIFGLKIFNNWVKSTQTRLAAKQLQFRLQTTGLRVLDMCCGKVPPFISLSFSHSVFHFSFLPSLHFPLFPSNFYSCPVFLLVLILILMLILFVLNIMDFV